MQFTRHIAGTIQGQVQHCILCGTIIVDNRGVCYPNDQQPPKGFPEGDIFVSDGSPKITTVEAPAGFFISECQP